MNLKEIKEMIELMKENEISEFELDKDGTKVVLKRGGRGTAREVIVETSPARHVPAAQPLAPAAPPVPAAPPENIVFIKSPMVGTFYRAASPEADPFVNRGRDVGPEDTVCIIEAMKVMNEIKAEVKGKILDILVENGEPVEFGQPLFKVEKG